MKTKEAVAETGTATNTKQYTVITDGDAVEVAKSIKEAKTALDNAIETYEQKLLGTPVIWMSKASSATLSKESGVSKPMIEVYRRTGRILGDFKQSSGVKPSAVATVVNAGFNAPGSFGTNVDPILDALKAEKDEPTWADAIAAIKKAIKGEGTSKSDAEKADDIIKRLTTLVTKGYALTDDQKAALAAL